MGRMGGSVDILMEHVSISRQHCCLQFRDDGILMVLDLGSAQGSFLNKVKLAKTVYQRVNVGDILRFGYSTRMYIINGPAEQMPSEYDSANMKLYREKLAMKAAKIEAKRLAVASEGKLLLTKKNSCIDIYAIYVFVHVYELLHYQESLTKMLNILYSDQ